MAAVFHLFAAYQAGKDVLSGSGNWLFDPGKEAARRVSGVNVKKTDSQLTGRIHW